MGRFRISKLGISRHRGVVQERASPVLGALVPKSLHLSQDMVQQIVSETQANRELSQPEIGKLASMLNLTLSPSMSAAVDFVPNRHPRNCASK
jgi:hypothetical protein